MAGCWLDSVQILARLLQNQIILRLAYSKLLIFLLTGLLP